MANTLKKIQTVTVGSGGAANIEFTNIPQTYTDLKIVSSLRVTYDGGNSWIDGIVTFNGSTSGYSERFLYGDGSTVGSANQASTGLKWAAFAVDSGATASVFSNNELYIPNYTSSNNKSVSSDSVTENNGTVAQQSLHAGLWSNSAAITSVTLTPGFGSFVQYSTATLYGVSNVTAASNAYATGGIITYDDTYVYHTFPWSGTFTPTRSLNVDYLVVAGGAGAGGAYTDANIFGSGGGGAGGVRCTVGATGGGGSLESQLSLTATAYTVTVGAGGAGGGDNTNGTSGSNSVFSTITSTGGGRSANAGGGNGTSGGSGGGGAGDSGTGGAGTANQGFAGGNGGGGTRSGGGGGGAGVAGTAAGAGGAGAGGNGITTSISGTSTTYGGGGGGAHGTGGSSANGGSGGGGNGGAPATSGTANTGGGGGGRRTYGAAGGTGGSGIVIVRYAK